MALRRGRRDAQVLFRDTAPIQRGVMADDRSAQFVPPASRARCGGRCGEPFGPLPKIAHAVDQVGVSVVGLVRPRRKAAVEQVAVKDPAFGVHGRLVREPALTPQSCPPTAHQSPPRARTQRCPATKRANGRPRSTRPFPSPWSAQGLDRRMARHVKPRFIFIGQVGAMLADAIDAQPARMDPILTPTCPADIDAIARHADARSHPARPKVLFALVQPVRAVRRMQHPAVHADRAGRHAQEILTGAASKSNGGQVKPT